MQMIRDEDMEVERDSGHRWATILNQKAIIPERITCVVKGDGDDNFKSSKGIVCSLHPSDPDLRVLAPFRS